jgi:hypothetical protein
VRSRRASKALPWRVRRLDMNLRCDSLPAHSCQASGSPGPPMMLGNANGCPCSVHPVVPPLRRATRLRRVPRSAAIRSSPLRRHFVPPKVAQVPIPPKWRDDTAPRHRLPTGISGWSVPNAGAAIQTWYYRRAALISPDGGSI